MKKSVSLLICLLLTVCLLAGCSEKSGLTASQFQKEMEDRGFTVRDYSDIPKNATKTLHATNSRLVVFHHTYSSEEAAADLVEGNIRIYETYAIERITVTETANGTRFVCDLDSTIYILSHVGNTVISILAHKEHSAEAKKLVEDLNY